MYSLTITSTEKRNSIPDNQDYLAVQFAITLDGEEVYAGSQGFPLEATAEDIQDSLSKFLTTFKEDTARAEENAKVEAIQKQADEVIETITGLEIHAE